MTVARDSVDTPVRPHNTGPSATWSSAGRAYDEVSRGIADAIEHCINRLTVVMPACEPLKRLPATQKIRHAGGTDAISSHASTLA